MFDCCKLTPFCSLHVYGGHPEPEHMTNIYIIYIYTKEVTIDSLRRLALLVINKYIYIFIDSAEKIINLCTLCGPSLKWSDNTGS